MGGGGGFGGRGEARAHNGVRVAELAKLLLCNNRKSFFVSITAEMKMRRITDAIGEIYNCVP